MKTKTAIIISVSIAAVGALAFILIKKKKGGKKQIRKASWIKKGVKNFDPKAVSEMINHSFTASKDCGAGRWGKRENCADNDLFFKAVEVLTPAQRIELQTYYNQSGIGYKGRDLCKAIDKLQGNDEEERARNLFEC
jgi:hypothetical protein